MTRYSFHVQLVPSIAQPGAFHLYVSHQTWDGKECKGGPEHIYGRKIFMQDPASADDLLNFAIEATDIVYQELTQELAKVKRPSNGETNARPSDTSVPS